VRPSHGRPHSHRPIVRPSENVCVTTMLGGPLLAAEQEARGVVEVPAKSIECNDGENPATVTSSALVL
jgi:hypothetical protein